MRFYKIFYITVFRESLIPIYYKSSKFIKRCKNTKRTLLKEFLGKSLNYFRMRKKQN